jgi:hypothetical protein
MNDTLTIGQVHKVDSKMKTELLMAVATVILSSTKSKKTKDCFKDSKLYHYRDGDLDSWLFENQTDGVKRKFTVYQLKKKITFREVTAAILGVDETSSIELLAKALIKKGHIVVLSQIEDAITQTSLGEDTGLLSKGCGNFFFVEDKKGAVSVVSVYRYDTGLLYVDINLLDCEVRLNVGYRFFSLN